MERIGQVVLRAGVHPDAGVADRVRSDARAVRLRQPLAGRVLRTRGSASASRRRCWRAGSTRAA